MAKGLNLRLHGNEKPSSCVAPNRWDDPAGFSNDDPRIMPVFVVPLGAFEQSGTNYTVPIISLASFYITGYQGQGGGFNNPCDDDDPAPDKASIVGHFFKYVSTDGSATGTTKCVLDSIGGCAAVMTR